MELSVLELQAGNARLMDRKFPEPTIPWGNALSLPERIELLRDASGAQLPWRDDGLGKARLAQWRGQAPFDEGELFQHKLTAIGIDEAELGQLLALPGEYFEQIASAEPAWMETFNESFRYYADAPSQFPKDPSISVDFAALLNVVNPLVAWGVDQLQREFSNLQSDSGWNMFCPAAIERQWLGALRGQLARMVARVLALELGVTRLESGLQGDTPQERYANFFASMRDADRALTVWRDYPVLARQVTELIQSQVSVLCEFLTHVAADWDFLEETFAGTGRLGRVIELSLNQGDAHAGGKGVIVVQFESGEKIVYKPRSLRVEANFQRLLRWLNERSESPSLRMLKVLDRGHHGWVEFVTHHGCNDEAEIHRFYHRQGAFTALFYALQANDVHAQNLIAAGEHPVPIDLETLFHPCVTRSDTDPIDRLIQRANEESVMKIGLLPRRVWAGDDQDGIDISGIGGGEGQLAPDAGLCWAEPGTDRMHVTRDQFRMAQENNRPALREENVSPYRYCHAVRSGFKSMYRLLMRHRGELLAADGPLSWFAQDEVRVVVRDTRTYAQLLGESYHPDFLRDAVNRDQMFDRLWLRTVHQPHFARVIEAEQRDLRARDIPLFTTRADSRDLWSSRGEQIEGYFDRTGMAAVRQRLTHMSEKDLGRQLWLIEMSLVAAAHGQGETARAVHSRCDSAALVSLERLIETSKSVADRLADLAVCDGQLATWFGSRYVHDRWSVELVGLDLYDGLSGISLYLAYLGNVTGDQSYTNIAKSAFATVEAYLREDDYQPPGPGGFTGVGGLVYAMSHLAVLWNRDDLIELAESLVGRIETMIDNDDQHDIVAGAAGCIAGLLSLYAVRPGTTTLAVARRCGDHLLAAAQRDGATASWTASNTAALALAGFSHGAAGIAHALTELFRVTGDQRYLRTAQAAIEFERSLFSPEDNNWLDRRDGHGHQHHDANSCMTAWCHGAPGIGLARVKALAGDDSLFDQSAIRSEIDAAVAATLKCGFGHNHSLCHGDLGNLEFLAAASAAQPDQALKDQVDRITAGILKSIERDGFLCGVPMAQQTPGLMNGLAGIGLGLLRMALPERVPSVLTLEPCRLRCDEMSHNS